MIPPNRYSDETIHVANWLIATAQTSLLLDLARKDTEQQIERHDLELDPEEYNERLHQNLVDRIDECFMEAFGECFPNHCAGSVNEIYGVGISPSDGYYQDATAEDLIRPFVGQALAPLCLEDVAEIIWAYRSPHYGELSAAVTNALTELVEAHKPA